MEPTKENKTAALRFACLSLFLTLLITVAAASSPDMKEISSDTSGTVGNPLDTVWIKAKVVNGDGLFITQYGDPGYLQYFSRSAGTITSDEQEIWVIYRCIAPGSDIPLRISLYGNGFVKEITKYVECEDMYYRARLSETDSRTSGTVGSDEDTVWIKAKAVNAEGTSISQYGEPGYLQYFSRSADGITSDEQTVLVKYKCITQGKDIPLRIRLVSNGRIIAELTKYVTCSNQDVKLSMTDSDTRGIVGSTVNTVWIKARAVNAKGMGISQWGDPEYISYVNHSGEYVYDNDQEIWTTYKCIAPGDDILLKIRVTYNGRVIKEATEEVSCIIQNPRLTETDSKVIGAIGTNEDLVWIKARAINANGMDVSQYGEPGHLTYVSRSAARVASDDQEIVITYRCIAQGNGIPLRMSLYGGGRFGKEITKYVTCNGINNPPNMLLIDSKETGVVGSADDLVWLKVKATNAKGMSIGQYGEPGHLSYLSRSAGIVSSDSQEYNVTYRCIAPGSNLLLKTWITKNGQLISGVTREVSCE